MTTIIFKPCDFCDEMRDDCITVSGKTICSKCHDNNCVSCSICGDNSQDGSNEICICSNCLEHSDGIVGAYRDLWDLTKR